MSDSGTWTGVGQGPSISSVVFERGKIRVYFSEKMSKNSDLLDASNYVFSVVSSGVAASVERVTPQDAEYPAYVDLTLNKQLTIGTSNYKLIVSNVVDVAGNGLAIGGNEKTFDGQAIRTTFIAEASLGNIQKVLIVFTANVKQVSSSNLDDALNPANYSITGVSIVSVKSVSSISSKSVELSVIGQVEGNYTLQINNVEDLSDNEVG